jgi:hypothetical protein
MDPAAADSAKAAKAAKIDTKPSLMVTLEQLRDEIFALSPTAANAAAAISQDAKQRLLQLAETLTRASVKALIEENVRGPPWDLCSFVETRSGWPPAPSHTIMALPPASRALPLPACPRLVSLSNPSTDNFFCLQAENLPGLLAQLSFSRHSLAILLLL